MSASSFKRRCNAIAVYHPNQGGKNAKYPVRGKHSRINLTEIIAGKHPYYQTDKLRRRLISEGVKKHECEICGIKEWLGQKVPVVLDHIDGNNSNHVLNNLRIICRNCDGNLENLRIEIKVNSKIIFMRIQNPFSSQVTLQLSIPR